MLLYSGNVAGKSVFQASNENSLKSYLAGQQQRGH